MRKYVIGLFCISIILALAYIFFYVLHSDIRTGIILIVVSLIILLFVFCADLEGGSIIFGLVVAIGLFYYGSHIIYDRFNINDESTKLNKVILSNNEEVPEKISLKVLIETIQALEKDGWQPSNSKQKVFKFISDKHWDKCIAIGKPAILPLMSVSKGEDNEEDNEKEIENIIETMAKIGGDDAFKYIHGRAFGVIYIRALRHFVGYNVNDVIINCLTIKDYLANQYESDYYRALAAMEVVQSLKNESYKKELLRTFQINKSRNASLINSLNLYGLGEQQEREVLINAVEKDHKTELLQFLGVIKNPADLPIILNWITKGITYRETVFRALDKFGWKPITEEEKVHYYVLTLNSKMLERNWQSTKEVLLNDFSQGDSSTKENAIDGFLLAESVLDKDQVLLTDLSRILDAIDKNDAKWIAQKFANSKSRELYEIADKWASKNGYAIKFTKRRW